MAFHFRNVTFGGVPTTDKALLFEDKAEVVFSSVEADPGLLLQIKAHNRLPTIDPAMVNLIISTGRLKGSRNQKPAL